jgi:hypothetical protein
MKSPIKDQRFKNVSINWLKNNLKKDLTIDTYNLFSGDIELSLSKSEYNVNAHTSKPVIFQFWQCMMTEPHRICSILTDPAFKFNEGAEFALLQENLPTYKDPFIRSSLFFMLNRCSKTGQISCGEFDTKNYNSIAINRIRRFKKPELFNVKFSENIFSSNGGDVILLPTMQFAYNFLKPSVQSYDTYQHDHRDLKKILKEVEKPIILIYNKHKALASFYKDFNLHYIDLYGNECNSQDEHEEVIVTNF